ncbi:MAG: hypothetical protein V1245_09270 [Arenicellales bacterium]|jgi:hypothetical protein|nr:hypothetical protein [Acidiferrobacteraceae bacterium]MDP7563763.1 hypothetical protein [Arenicellales bacterium]MEE1559587.1 hypothetical protein [Arenicellales bacterium]|tara:strand:+ start:161 stop:985 length:825 start_codon:yes stop_codon:yes gene_type:complete
MTKTLAALVIHGIGRQQPDFANGMIKAVSAHLAAQGSDPQQVAWQPVFWDDILRPAQDAYLQAAYAAADLNARRLRTLVLSALGDAAGYRQLPSGGRRGGEETQTYHRVHARLREAMRSLYRRQLDGRPVPLVVLAHSFGGHILSNYVWDSQHRPDQRLSSFERMNWLCGLVTFGCNIPLFTFACHEVQPITFPPPRLPARFKERARWLNFFDPDDVLGWPLKPINAAYDQVVSLDQRINVGGPVTGWTPASHLAYWTDRRFTRRVADFLLTLL